MVPVVQAGRPLMSTLIAPGKTASPPMIFGSPILTAGGIYYPVIICLAGGVTIPVVASRYLARTSSLVSAAIAMVAVFMWTFLS